MKIAIGCDHGGINLKSAVIKAITDLNFEFTDYGCFDQSSVDYPDYAIKVCRAIIAKEANKGILICGTGIGMSIIANKFDNIRCGHCVDAFSAEMTARHNDSNVIALGGRISDEETAYKIVKSFLSAKFEGGRHQQRLDKINLIEQQRS